MRRGYTLLELLVVLAVLAAIVAVAVPRFLQLYARVSFAFQRDDVERQLLELPQEVRRSGRGGILFDPSAGVHPGDTAAAAATVGSARAFEEWQPLRMELPGNWSLRVPNPILYHFTGACEGGEVILTVAGLSNRYVLTPPLCRPRLADASQS